LLGILREVLPGLVVRRTRINGQPGIIGYYADGQPQSVTTFDGIRASRILVNPEKLQNIPLIR